MHHLEVACCNGKKISIKATGLLYKSRSAYQDIAIYDTEEFGRCLFLDGVIQCSEKDHAAYDRALLKQLRPSDRRLLILGGGDGYTAELALQLNPALAITVVDLDAEVVAACRQHLGQQVFADPRLQLVTADALKFMEQVGNARYDGVVCDLTDFPVGYNDGAFREFYSTVFPLARQVLKDDGWLGVYVGSRDAVGNGGLPVTAALAEMLTGLFARVEKQEAMIPSYGEPVCFLHAQVSGADTAAWIYTPLDQAREEVRKRWDDQALRKEVAAYLGDIPAPFALAPRSVLFRNVMTPDNEFVHFLKLSHGLQLPPLGLEFVEDKFYTRNADKLGLGRLSFLNPHTGNGNPSFHYRRVIDMKVCDNHRFCDIATNWGENLVEFHHRLVSLFAPGTELYDLSDWIKARGTKAVRYYPHFLTLFICHGVLFENFITDESEKEFSEEIVLPAIAAAESRFGVKPLIVPLIPVAEVLTKYWWWCYPAAFEKEVEQYG